jgi:hypothetical protein
MIYTLSYKFKSGSHKGETLKHVMDNCFEDVCKMMRTAQSKNQPFKMDEEAMSYYLERVQDFVDGSFKKSNRKVYSGKRY